MKGPYEKYRDIIIALANPGCNRVIMSLAAAKLADKIIVEEDPIQIVRLLTGMIGRFENRKYTAKTHDEKNSGPVEWYWKLNNKCKYIRILRYQMGFGVYIGNREIALVDSVVHEQFEDVYQLIKNPEVVKKSYTTESLPTHLTDYIITDPDNDLFIIKPYYDKNNGGTKQIGMLIEQSKEPIHKIAVLLSTT